MIKATNPIPVGQGPSIRIRQDSLDAKSNKKSPSKKKSPKDQAPMEDDWAFLEDDLPGSAATPTTAEDDFVMVDERVRTFASPAASGIIPRMSPPGVSLSPPTPKNLALSPSSSYVFHTQANSIAPRPSSTPPNASNLCKTLLPQHNPLIAITYRPISIGFLDERKYQKMIANEPPTTGKGADGNLWKGIKIAEDPIKARLKLKFLIRKGVPADLRRHVWMSVTGAYYFVRSQSQSPEELYQAKLHEIFGPRLPEKILKPPLFGGQLTSEFFFLREEAQMSLKRTLVILGMDFPDLKFSPMIPDVISLMLHFMNERDTFFCIYSMVQESQKDHRYITFSPTDVNVYLLTFKDVLKKVVPRLYQHMKKKLNLDIKQLSENWFNHLFLHDLPFRTVLRVFDTFLNEGYRVLYRIALGLLSAKEASLLTAKDAETFVNIIKQSASQVYNDDMFLKSCFKISLHPDKVSKYKSKNKVKSRLEDSHYPHHIYYRPKVSTPSSIISEDVFEIIYEWIPMRYRITDPVLLYTSTTEGFSLKRFLKKIEDQEPTLLFLKSDSGNAFGAYISSKWRITGQFSFTGTRECFLFQLMPRLKKWGWMEGSMEAFLSVEPTGFSIGGGGSGIGLYVNDDWTGSSGECDTFKNDPLNGDQSDKFEIVSVEVWGFQ